jgi:hypothetical protein
MFVCVVSFITSLTIFFGLDYTIVQTLFTSLVIYYLGGLLRPILKLCFLLRVVGLFIRGRVTTIVRLFIRGRVTTMGPK